MDQALTRGQLSLLLLAGNRLLLGVGLEHLCLLLVDELHQDTLVLEDVTLGLEVELVVQVTINLLGLPVSLEKATEDPHPLDPETLLRGPGVLGTLPLTKASVTSLAPSPH